MDEKLIIVTGFGPFQGHEDVNASWEAVSLLPNELNFKGSIYKMEKILVPVEYDAVDSHVEEIWKRNPELVIHCGVNGGSNCIHLEQFAFNSKFTRADYCGKRLGCPTLHLRNGGTCMSIATKLDVSRMERYLNLNTFGGRRTVKCSQDAGNYLCNYIYLKSLDVDANRCLFIHVPPIGKPLTSHETSSAIHKVIEECLKQID